MADYVGTASILLSLHNAMDDAFRHLRGRLPDELHPQGPDLHLFQGFEGTGGAGADVAVIARHQDGRQLSWMVQIWIERRTDDGEWYATVTGEIDLDDDLGEDYCVLNEQRPVDSAEEAADAIRELASMVVEYPLSELLAKRWSAEEHEAGDGSGEAMFSVTEMIAKTPSSHHGDPPKP